MFDMLLLFISDNKGVDFMLSYELLSKPRVTNKDVKELLEQINSSVGTNFSLQPYGDKYNLKSNSKVVSSGTLREVLWFLSGAEWFATSGVGVSGNTSASASTKISPTSVLGYFISHINSSIVTKARKRAVDTYYSQEILCVSIKILDAGVDGVVVYQCTRKNITPNGLGVGGSTLVSPIVRHKISKSVPLSDIESVIVEMLKVDEEALLDKVVKDASMRNNLRPDSMLWLTPEVMRRLGWSNSKMITTSVVTNTKV